MRKRILSVLVPFVPVTPESNNCSSWTLHESIHVDIHTLLGESRRGSSHDHTILRPPDPSGVCPTGQRAQKGSRGNPAPGGLRFCLWPGSQATPYVGINTTSLPTSGFSILAYVCILPRISYRRDCTRNNIVLVPHNPPALSFLTHNMHRHIA